MVYRSTGIDAKTVEARLRAFTPKRVRAPGFRPAAVLVPMFQDNQAGRIRVWVFRRTTDRSPHSGQVSLPGGKPNSPDEDLRTTALREAWEEIGLPADNVEVLSELDEFVTLTGFVIRPFASLIPTDFQPVPNPGEVARLFSVPLDTFAAPPQEHEVQWGPIRRNVPAYLFDGEIVWGATFSILRALAATLYHR